jgi:predicted nucleic acid-binding protein
VVEDTVFVDGDVFLRFLVRDVEKYYLTARDMFERAESGSIRLVTTEIVITGIVSALESDFGFSRMEAKDVVDAILGTRNLKVPNRAVLKTAARLYGMHDICFADAYNIAFLRSMGLGRIATFDRKHYRVREEGIKFYA